MKKNFSRVLSGVLAVMIAVPNLMQLAASAEEGEKFQYTMFGRNGVTMSASANLCMNGNLHTNKDAAITATNKNLNGTVTTSADIEKRVKHVYADQKIYDTYFTTNCELHEEEYVYSDMNIHINNPLFCYNNIILNGNVSLNSSLGALMNINVTGEVKNANNSVVYSKYGNITIENDSTANVNGLIYAPLGTVTINSPNVTINGIIIADQVVINGSSVNINGNDSIARFIGETSENYDYSGLEYLPEEWLGDTDADGLFDIYEKVIDSDPFNPDTDGDGLPDGYEVIDLNTDPLEIDTDADTISDADEDFDEDGLTNLEEYLNGTKPYNPDSDDDGLEDGEEIYLYGTNPSSEDTDEDGLYDNEEGTYGLLYKKYGILFDPVNPHTIDANLLDGEIQFKQEHSQVVDTHDDAITSIAVVMEANGNLERDLSIESVYDIDLMSTNIVGLVGDPFSFETNSTFDSATITFTVDQRNLGTSNFSDLIVLWYDEENQKYVECTAENGFKTTLNTYTSTISVDTTHFSKYMLVDSKAWYDVWEESYRKISAATPTTSTGSTTQVLIDHYNTVFVIDTSGSMSDDPNGGWIGYDPLVRVLRDDAPPRPPITDAAMEAYWLANYGKNTCKRITACENVIDKMYSNDQAAIISFSYGNSSYTKILSSLTSNKTVLKDSLQNFSDVGGTCFSYALDQAVELLLSSEEIGRDDVINRIVFLSDGEPDNDTLENINSAVAYAANNGIQIITFGLGSSSGDSILTDISEKTNGQFYKVIYADDLPRVISTATYTEIESNPDFSLIMEMDSDGDGVPDVIEEYGLRPNGELLNTDKGDSNSDDDDLSDGEEIIIDKELLEDNLNEGNAKTGITTPTDPTATTDLNPYGQIEYKGEVYKIDVPTLKNRSDQYYYEPVYELAETFTPDEKTEFDMFGFITGRKTAVTDDLHDGSQEITGYTFTNKYGYIKDTFRNEKNYTLASSGIILISNTLEMVNGSYSRKGVKFSFYKTKNNDARKVIIHAYSTDAERMYDAYATGMEYSAFINNSGSPLVQIMISNACRDLYTELTGINPDNSRYYDLVMRVDERHKGSGCFAELWIDDTGNVVAAQKLYSEDSVKLVSRSSWFYLFGYDTLLNLQLSDNINLECTFVDMFNKIYEQN